jgi:hypothetical protein
VAQHIANHESQRTTKLWAKRRDEISLDEIERMPSDFETQVKRYLRCRGYVAVYFGWGENLV